MLDALRNIKLTISQYALLTGAAIIGALIVALRIRTSEVHRLRVDLLKDHFDLEMEKSNGKVDKAAARYQAAKDAYTKGKRKKELT